MTKLTGQDTYLIKRRNLRNDYHSCTFGPFNDVKKCRPGSFVHLRIPSLDVFFRRAMSVASVDTVRKELEIIFKVVGRGTAFLAGLSKQSQVNFLGPLGNGFTLPRKSESAVIVAGGIGFPPLMYLVSEMVSRGFNPGQVHFFYGGRSGDDVVEHSRIKRLGVCFHPMTDDGSFGRRGLVTEAVEEYIRDHSGEKMRLFGCGPEPMLKVVDELGLKYKLPGQLSLEAPMPCGIGVCLGCVVTLRAGGHARVCRDGPVFDIGEVLL
jgi:dihydroorotate dehydrogenase electron transfer subunit